MVDVRSILENIKSRDKDIRFMALMDLLTEVQRCKEKNDTKPFSHDAERQFTSILVDIVKDTSGDIQGLVVKVFGLFVRCISVPQVESIAKTLVNHLISGEKDTHRDVASLSLRNIVSDALDDHTDVLLNHVMKPVVQVLLDDQLSDAAQTDCLDLLGALMIRFHANALSYHASLVQAGVMLLGAERSNTHRKAIHFLSLIAVHLSDALFDQLVRDVVQSLSSKHVLPLVRCFAGLSATNGHRLSPHLPQFVPFLLKRVQACKEEEEDLMEACLLTFEAMMGRCPRDSAAYVDAVTTVALSLLTYDPNFNDVMDVDDDALDGFSDDGFGSGSDGFFDDEDDFDLQEEMDVDDPSWKVRKAAARCLGTIVRHHPAHLSSLLASVGPRLVERFKEREESVRLEVIASYHALVRQVGHLLSEQEDMNDGDAHLSDVSTVLDTILHNVNAFKQQPNSVLALLQLLRGVLNTVSGAAFPSASVDAMMDTLLPLLSKDASNHTSAIRISVLGCMRVTVAHQDPSFASVEGLEQQLSRVIRICSTESYYKVLVEALETLLVMIQCPRLAASTLSDQVFEVVQHTLQLTDVDVKVKEKAILCMAYLLRRTGAVGKRGATVLDLLVDRLRNEVTRLTAHDAFCIMAKEGDDDQDPVALDDVMEPITELCLTHLKKVDRRVKVAALRTLSVWTHTFGAALVKSKQNVLQGCVEALDVSDLHVTHMALQVIHVILSNAKGSTKTSMVTHHVRPAALALAHAPSMQGVALDSLVSLYRLLATSKSTLPKLLDELHQLNSDKRSAQVSTAKCLAAVIQAATKRVRDESIRHLLDVASEESQDKANGLLCLTALGEVGRVVDLKSYAPETILCRNLDSTDDRIRTISSTALGCIALGNLSHYVPLLVEEIGSSAQNRRFLLLYALREVIEDTHSRESLHVHLETFRALLFELATGEEKGTRTIVSECLGKLALVDPATMIASMAEHVDVNGKGANPFMRCTVTSALRYAIYCDADILAPFMEQFLALLTDSDIHVQTSAVHALIYAIQHRPSLVLANLPLHLEKVYALCAIREDLIRTVIMGPYKRQVDDGEDCRKAAYETIYLVLGKLHDMVQLPMLMPHVTHGLRDTLDIQTLSCLILVRLSEHCGDAWIKHVDPLLDPLRKMMFPVVKDKNMVKKDEEDMNNQLMDASVMAVRAMNKVPVISSHKGFTDLIESIPSSEALYAKWSQI